MLLRNDVRDRAAGCAALNDDSIKAEAGEPLRSLIERVVLAPAADAPNGVDAQLHGDLAAIVALTDNVGRKQELPAKGMAGSQLSLVAGTRDHLDKLVRTPGNFALSLASPSDF